jgi:hypothetical protein
MQPGGRFIAVQQQSSSGPIFPTAACCALHGAKMKMTQFDTLLMEVKIVFPSVARRGNVMN